jgi:hypothetical protein
MVCYELIRVIILEGNMHDFSLSVASLIGATSVASAPLLFHRCRTSTKRHPMWWRLWVNSITATSWLLLLIVGMLVSEVKDMVVGLLYWILQLVITIQILITLRE